MLNLAPTWLQQPVNGFQKHAKLVLMVACAAYAGLPADTRQCMLLLSRRDAEDPGTEVVAAEPQTVTLSQPEFWCAEDSTGHASRQQAWFGGLAEVCEGCFCLEALACELKIL